MSLQNDKLKHEFFIKERREMKIFGVTDIDSFDECAAVLQTTDGEMTVEGNELKIGALDTDSGIVTVSGKINGIFYSGDEPRQKRGIISRIFK